MSEIATIIAGEIHRQGAISAARFMELALYCPVYGFYEKEADTIGKRGHFYTSISVGPLYGELLAFDFASRLERGAAGDAWVICEAGAHDGRLARDILDWVRQHRPRVYDQLSYIVLEASPGRTLWQQNSLREHRIVQWRESLSGLVGIGGPDLKRASTVVFCNEFLDALPVHVARWCAPERRWFEMGVALNARGEFVWKDLPEVSPDVTPMLPDQARSEALPDGYRIELCPRAIEWWRQAAEAIHHGWLITFDYGLTSEDRLAPERSGGTLRAYRKHHVRPDLLRDAGEQDLTAHVDFDAVLRAGEAAGLHTEELSGQGRYLGRIAARMIEARLEWDLARRRQFQTLTHPQHLGHSFKVLVQRRVGGGLVDGHCPEP